jgi:hypothetical protein
LSLEGHRIWSLFVVHDAYIITTLNEGCCGSITFFYMFSFRWAAGKWLFIKKCSMEKQFLQVDI